MKLEITNQKVYQRISYKRKSCVTHWMSSRNSQLRTFDVSVINSYSEKKNAGRLRTYGPSVGFAQLLQDQSKNCHAFCNALCRFVARALGGARYTISLLNGQKQQNRQHVGCTLPAVKRYYFLVFTGNIRFAEKSAQKQRHLKALLLRCPWTR